MIRTLSCLTLCIFLLTVLSFHQVLANQKIRKQSSTSFFSFFENYLIVYNTTTLNNKSVLAAHTKNQEISLTQTMTQPAAQSAPQTITPPSYISSYILNGVNDYRTSLGLSPVSSSVQTCAFAATRANEITTAFNHDGFYDRVNNHAIPYTNWARAVENIAETPDYKKVVTLWKNSPEHAANMRDNIPYVCIMQSGNYYAYEGMRP